MSTQWGRQRKAATEAGARHAQGGPDLRGQYSSLGPDVRDAYDRGLNNEKADMRQREERELHPLRLISREANSLSYGENEQVRSLADLIERLADYMLEKES